MSLSKWFLFVLVAVCVYCSTLTWAAPVVSHLPHMSFQAVETDPSPKLVLFYFKEDLDKDDKLAETVEILSKTFKYLTATSDNNLRSFRVILCDGSAAENVDAFRRADFKAGSFHLFTATQAEGIVKYTIPLKFSTLIFSIRSKFFDPSDYQADDLLQFSNEDAFYDELDGVSEKTGLTYPIFVKFYEQWCTHCKRLAPIFSYAATFFKPWEDSYPQQGGVKFLEVECSKTDLSKAFCNKYSVTGYPKVMLFTGEKTYDFTHEIRSVLTFDEFFVKHLNHSQVENQKDLLHIKSHIPSYHSRIEDELKALEKEEERFGTTSTKAKKQNSGEEKKAKAEDESAKKQEKKKKKKKKSEKKSKKSKKSSTDEADIDGELDLSKLGAFSKPVEVQVDANMGQNNNIQTGTVTDQDKQQKITQLEKRMKQAEDLLTQLKQELASLKK